MEGMFLQELLPMQEDCVNVGEFKLPLGASDQRLVIKLLDSTHGQWLY